VKPNSILLVASFCMVLEGSASSLDLTVPAGETYVITSNQSHNVIQVYGTLQIDSGDVTVAARS